MATCFPRFHDLPKELRLRIWEDALPTAGELILRAVISNSSPSRELNLYFERPSPSCAKETAQSYLSDWGGLRISYEESIKAALIKMRSRQLAQDRVLSLLDVNFESREVYLSNLPIELSCGPGGFGKLRMARNDALHIVNMDSLLGVPEFRHALSEGYRLQDWWRQVEHVRMPLSVLLFTRYGDVSGQGLEAAVASLKMLRVLDLVKWDECVPGYPAVFKEILIDEVLGRNGYLEGGLELLLGPNWRERQLGGPLIQVKQRIWDQERFIILRAFYNGPDLL